MICQLIKVLGRFIYADTSPLEMPAGQPQAVLMQVTERQRNATRVLGGEGTSSEKKKKQKRAAQPAGDGFSPVV